MSEQKIEKDMKLLNVNEAALKLSVSPITVRKWQHQGKLPFIKLFGTVRFESSALDSLILSMRTKKEIAL